MKNRLTTGLFVDSIVPMVIVVIALGMVCTRFAPFLSGQIPAQEVRFAQSKTDLSPLLPDTTRPMVSAPVSPSHFPTTSQVIPPLSAPSTSVQYVSPTTQTAPATKNDSFRIFGGTLLGERNGKSGSKPAGWSFTRRRQSDSSRSESGEYESEQKMEFGNYRNESPLTFEGILDDPIYSQTSGQQVNSGANDSFESFTVILPEDQEEGEFLSGGNDFKIDKSMIPGPQMSPWGAFQVGSWCRMKTTSTSFEGGTIMRTAAEIKLTLLGVDTDGYVLQKETSIKMGNLAHNKPIEIIKYDFLGVPTTPNQNLELAPTSLSIARKIIPCQLRQIDRISPLQQETSLLWYSSVVSPYLLQKETRIYDLQRGGKRLLSTSTTTLSKSAANTLLGGNTLGWQSMTVVQKEESTATTITIHSNRVPGWILRETTTETDATGRMLFTSTTTLLDYFNARW